MSSLYLLTGSHGPSPSSQTHRTDFITLTPDSRGKNTQELCNAKTGLNNFVVGIPKEALVGTSLAQPSFGMTPTTKYCHLPMATQALDRDITEYNPIVSVIPKEDLAGLVS